jgi:hypothetical protein
LANHLLCLGRVITNETLCAFGGLCGVLAGKSLDLLGLIIDDLCGVGEVVINKFLVGLVD